MSKKGTIQTIELNDGRTITIETGKLAKQADGSAIVKMGDTMLLATVVSNKEASENVSFFPLSVDYKEKYAAAGRFPGGFFKREARPSEHEILISRLVDRALRPLFPDDYYAETQILISLISAEKDVMPDALACLAASSALAVSDIPFNGPISEARVARINNQFVINPKHEEMEEADIDLIVAATKENVVMVEGEMKEVSESDMVEAIKFAHEQIKVQCEAQTLLAEKIEKAKVKREYSHIKKDEELKATINKELREKIYAVTKQFIQDKQERKEAYKKILEEFLETLPEEEKEEKASLADQYFHDIQKEVIRTVTLAEKTRIDRRKTDEIRPIWSEIDYLPSAHGSAVFTRGETQSLTTITLGTKLDEQVIDGAVIEGKSNFILHYNFPPFCTGEAKFLRGTSRREIGHGHLAMRALKNIMPEMDDNPYTVRIVSDILESNGSSSMATVCAGTLALMDAGIQIKKPVSGIAMGLISDKDSGKYAVLSDILGDEDHLGDMDFKVTGTKDGVTACQMDIKTEGLSYDILIEALEQAKAGRIHILDKMLETIPEPRPDYKPHAPRIEKLTVHKEFIGAIIGSGGKVIQELQETTNTTIVIEEVGDMGVIEIASSDKASIEAAREKIEQIITVPQIGDVYKGKVKEVLSFGAIVEILPGKDGLLHISEIDWKHIKSVTDVMNEGDEVEVKLIEVDKNNGRLKLSRKALLPRPEGMPEQKDRNRGRSKDRDRNRDKDRRNKRQ